MSTTIEIDCPGKTFGGGATNRLCGSVDGMEWSVYIGEYNLAPPGEPVNHVSVTRFYVSGRFDVVCYGPKAHVLNGWVIRSRERRDLRVESVQRDLLSEVLGIVIPWMTGSQAILVINSAFEAGRTQGRRDLQGEVRQILNLG